MYNPDTQKNKEKSRRDIIQEFIQDPAWIRFTEVIKEDIQQQAEELGLVGPGTPAEPILYILGRMSEEKMR